MPHFLPSFCVSVSLSQEPQGPLGYVAPDTKCLGFVWVKHQTTSNQSGEVIKETPIMLVHKCGDLCFNCGKQRSLDVCVIMFSFKTHIVFLLSKHATVLWHFSNTNKTCAVITHSDCSLAADWFIKTEVMMSHSPNAFFLCLMKLQWLPPVSSNYSTALEMFVLVLTGHSPDHNRLCFSLQYLLLFFPVWLILLC